MSSQTGTLRDELDSYIVQGENVPVVEMFAGKEPKVQIVTCPVDGKPCDPECPDRFHDTPDGGCFLTVAMEHADAVLLLEGNSLTPIKEDEP